MPLLWCKSDSDASRGSLNWIDSHGRFLENPQVTSSAETVFKNPSRKTYSEAVTGGKTQKNGTDKQIDDKSTIKNKTETEKKFEGESFTISRKSEPSKESDETKILNNNNDDKVIQYDFTTLTRDKIELFKKFIEETNRLKEILTRIALKMESRQQTETSDQSRKRRSDQLYGLDFSKLEEQVHEKRELHEALQRVQHVQEVVDRMDCRTFSSFTSTLTVLRNRNGTVELFDKRQQEDSILYPKIQQTIVKKQWNKMAKASKSMLRTLFSIADLAMNPRTVRFVEEIEMIHESGDLSVLQPLPTLFPRKYPPSPRFPHK